MAKAESLDKKITAYLTQLTVRQKKTLLTVAKTFAEEPQEDERWEDSTFIAEMDKRFAEYEGGKKGITLDELESKVRHTYKNKKAGNNEI